MPPVAPARAPETAPSKRAPGDDGRPEAGAAAESELRAQIVSLEAERDATVKRLETAAVRMDATIERLRGALGD